MNEDRILIRGLQFFGYHGVIPEENTLGQRFLVDIEIGTDLQAAGQSDDLRKTIDYVAVQKDVRDIVEGPPHKLIERVAERIAERVLGTYGGEWVRVCVKKPHVPVAATLDYVGVEVFRRRTS
ncbi:MAG TPA: dihydroneopterin aldolase [Gemmatimonadaceae bacterium]|nr:dihydroneopterin aldolase [Gemmatimonadaceae bacterium]